MCLCTTADGCSTNQTFRSLHRLYRSICVCFVPAFLLSSLPPRPLPAMIGVVDLILSLNTHTYIVVTTMSLNKGVRRNETPTAWMTTRKKMSDDTQRCNQSTWYTPTHTPTLHTHTHTLHTHSLTSVTANHRLLCVPTEIVGRRSR